jgi:hypothetical protein
MGTHILKSKREGQVIIWKKNEQAIGTYSLKSTEGEINQNNES